MAERAFPLDNTLYYSDDLRLFHAGRTGGILNYTGNDFSLINVSGMSVTIGKGLAFLKTGEENPGGIVYRNDENISLRFDSPTASTRYDYIAIQYDSFNNSVTMKTVRGGASMPLPVRASGIWELILYVVKISGNTSALSQSEIIDTRNEENLCGLTVDTLLKIPTDGYQRQFSAFMDELKVKLGENVAGNLQNQIDDLEDRLDEFLNGTGTGNSILDSIKKLQSDVKANTDGLMDIEDDVDKLSRLINSRPAIVSIGSGLSLSTDGRLSTVTPPIKIGTATPTATMLEEGQIYLQV